MPNKEALTAFHQEAIAEVADRLFLAKGYQATSMDDIAREADYSKATLYVYFKSKEQIHYYILLKAMKLLYERIRAGLASSPDALEQYWAICKEFQKYSEQHPTYYQALSETIATDQSSRNSDPLLQSIYEAGERVNGITQEVLDNGVAQGYFRELPPVSAGMLYGSMLTNAIQLAGNKAEYIEQRTGMSRDDFLQFAFDTMLRGLLREGGTIREEKN